ncbi:MAG: hypothetical protein HY678_00270 [Chloroflexi bacterium]|nr:hypothetical protein [Chloroflexota bacterium]
MQGLEIVGKAFAREFKIANPIGEFIHAQSRWGRRWRQYGYRFAVAIDDEPFALSLDPGQNI